MPPIHKPSAKKQTDGTKSITFNLSRTANTDYQVMRTRLGADSDTTHTRFSPTVSACRGLDDRACSLNTTTRHVSTPAHQYVEASPARVRERHSPTQPRFKPDVLEHCCKRVLQRGLITVAFFYRSRMSLVFLTLVRGALALMNEN
jgi:hypothetical protein